MPARIRIPDGIIVDKRVPIPGLRPLRGGGDDRVGREEASQRAVIPACVEEVNAGAGFFRENEFFCIQIQLAEQRRTDQKFMAIHTQQSASGDSWRQPSYRPRKIEYNRLYYYYYHLWKNAGGIE